MNDDGCSALCRIQEVQAPPLPEVSCDAGGIVLNTKTVGDKYYLYRAPVNNATKYLVYRQESQP